MYGYRLGYNLVQKGALLNQPYIDKLNKNKLIWDGGFLESSIPSIADFVIKANEYLVDSEFNDPLKWTTGVSWGISDSVASFDGLNNSALSSNVAYVESASAMRLEFKIKNAPSSASFQITTVGTSAEIEGYTNYANGNHVVDFDWPATNDLTAGISGVKLNASKYLGSSFELEYLRLSRRNEVNNVAISDGKLSITCDDNFIKETTYDKPIGWSLLYTESITPLKYKYGEKVGDFDKEVTNRIVTKTLTIIGDSIDVISSYPLLFSRADYNIINHAVAGAAIIKAGNQMDTQVIEAASDNADVIVIKMGTNDDNSGDMVALQTEAEANIGNLKLSNPNAEIYWVNILPEWTTAAGTTPIDNSNVRAVISAACVSTEINNIDPYTTPWIAASDTVDGTHLNSTGKTKVYTEIEARI